MSNENLAIAMIADAMESASTESAKLPTSASVLAGMYTLGQALQGDGAAYAMLILTTRNTDQRNVAAALYQRKYGSTPTTELLMNKAWEEFDAIHQPRLRRMLTDAIDDETRNERRLERLQVQHEQDELRKHLKKTHEPHVMGTVKEMAEKYRVSLSEIRRRKAEGTLEELANPVRLLKTNDYLTVGELFPALLTTIEHRDVDEFLAFLKSKGVIPRLATKDYVLNHVALVDVNKHLGLNLKYEITGI